MRGSGVGVCISLIFYIMEVFSFLLSLLLLVLGVLRVGEWGLELSGEIEVRSLGFSGFTSGR